MRRRIGIWDKCLLAACLLAAISSCASYAPALALNHEFSSSKGYLYGRFIITSGSAIDDTSRAHVFGLAIENTARTKKYIIGFTPHTEVFAIEVEAGEYEITGISVPGIDDRQRLGYGWPAGVSFTVQPGTAYYVGDYSGSTYVAGGYRTSSINAIADHFADSTSYFLIKYEFAKYVTCLRAFDFTAARVMY